MLMALLYTTEDRIAAAAPACDQAPYGDQYWSEFHSADLQAVDDFETAYVTITDRDLQAKLLMLGVDESVDGVLLAQEVTSSIAPDYSANRAA